MRFLLFYGIVLASVQAAALSAQETPSPFVLGVQTHFQQGWNIDLLEPAKTLGAVALRDEIRWDQVETEKGVYDFTVADAYMRPLMDQGFVPLIVVNEVNPLYDGGKTPHTGEGRAAFAAYISAILSHYGADAVKIEIGNEVNTTDFVSGPALKDPPRSFAALTRAVDAKLQADHPGVQFSCSGLNAIGIGFYRKFFRRGGLLACDAISVHPYREHPETLPGELHRLKALMQEFGGEKPIQVTEFGDWFDDAKDAPDYMMKMVTLMAAADVSEAYWYALTDEPYWPNMGLLEISGDAEKPAAATFSFLQKELLPLGRPQKQGANQATHLYHFGTDGRGAVFWGSGGQIDVGGNATYYDAQGTEIAPVDALSNSPVIVLGTGISITANANPRISDNMYQYGQQPWSYYARHPEIGLVPLEIIDSNWTTTRGAPDLFPLQIGDSWVTTARFADKPYSVVERFTADQPGRYKIGGWWQASAKTDTPQVRILHNALTILEAQPTKDRVDVSDQLVTLERGDTLDFEILPQAPGGAGALQRRIRITGPIAND